ncbi:MAG: glycine--tRNA ligase subunit beta, partial [Syntrophales bacterium LBB04]|nr:glycine--tRNA ligase subunit beta [Syntrophales bacterium LBB04]
ANIIKDFKGGPVDPGLFEGKAEEVQLKTYLETKAKVDAFINRGDYLSGLREMAHLRRPVDDFFEAVLVMAPKDEIRINRLSLLEAISGMFREIADFAKIVTSP